MAKSQSGKGKSKKRDYAHGLLMRLKRAKFEKDQPTIELIMAEISGRYYGRFFNCALRVSGKTQAGLTKEDAQEIANDTLRKINAGIKTYRERGSKKLKKRGSGGESWMMAVCENLARDWINQRKKTIPTIPTDKGVEPVGKDIILDGGETYEEQAEHEQRILIIHKAKQSLSEEDQKILDHGEGEEGYEEAFERWGKAVLSILALHNNDQGASCNEQ